MMKFSYFFSRPAAPLLPAAKLYPYEYNEFTLSLPEDWKQVPTADERTLNWYSEKEEASFAVSIDFHEVPENKWAALAEINLDSRHRVLANASHERVTVISRGTKPYSGGGALELSYAAHTTETTYLYLGYVTSRKVFNFTLTSSADKATAIDLYNKTMQQWLRVEVP